MGAIWVDSEEQKGSDFSVILPLKDDKKIFEMDLSKALINNDDVGVLKFSYNKDLNLVEILKEQKLLNFTRLSKELLIENEDKIEFYAFVPKISFESLNALCVTIEEYCSKIRNDECDIILKKVHSKKDGLDSSNLIKILNN